MGSAGIGSVLFAAALVGAPLVACGSTTRAQSGAGGGTGGSATSGASTGGASAAKAGAHSASGTANGGAGAPPLELTEADSSEPCEADPLAPHWHETLLTFSAGETRSFKLGAGGPLALAVSTGPNGLLARTSTDDGAWTAERALPDSVVDDYPERIEVSPDGSTALVLWRRGQRMFFSLLEATGSIGRAVELAVPQDVDVLALPGQRVLFGYGSEQGIQILEYTPASGLVAVPPVLANYSRMFRDEGDAVLVFSARSVPGEPDKSYSYRFGTGFAAMQPLSPRLVSGSVSQTFFFSFPLGRGARVMRAAQDPGTRGLHVTTKQGASWGAEQHVGRFEGSFATTPAIGYAGEHLILAWQDEDKDVTVVREHADDTWGPEQPLPRSRALRQLAMVSAKESALVLGEQVLPAENVSVKKLYRRGKAGVWYCPKLLPKGFGNELVSDGEGFWFGDLLQAPLHLWRFKP